MPKQFFLFLESTLFDMILICAILVAFLFAMCAWSILKNRNLSKMLKDVPGPTAAPIVGTLMALYTFAGNQGRPGKITVAQLN